MGRMTDDFESNRDIEQALGDNPFFLPNLNMQQSKIAFRADLDEKPSGQCKFYLQDFAEKGKQWLERQPWHKYKQAEQIQKEFSKKVTARMGTVQQPKAYQKMSSREILMLELKGHFSKYSRIFERDKSYLYRSSHYTEPENMFFLQEWINRAFNHIYESYIQNGQDFNFIAQRIKFNNGLRSPIQNFAHELFYLFKLQDIWQVTEYNRKLLEPVYLQRHLKYRDDLSQVSAILQDVREESFQVQSSDEEQSSISFVTFWKPSLINDLSKSQIIPLIHVHENSSAIFIVEEQILAKSFGFVEDSFQDFQNQFLDEIYQNF